MVIVSFVHGPKAVDPGMKGTFAAPGFDLVRGIKITELQLIDNAIHDGIDGETDPKDLFTIVKAEAK
jgi:hypothetical protein